MIRFKSISPTSSVPKISNAASFPISSLISPCLLINLLKSSTFSFKSSAEILYFSTNPKKSSKHSSTKYAAEQVSILEFFSTRNSCKITILKCLCNNFLLLISIHGFLESPRNMGIGFLKYKVSWGPSSQNVTIVDKLDPRLPARPALCW